VGAGLSEIVLFPGALVNSKGGRIQRIPPSWQSQNRCTWCAVPVNDDFHGRAAKREHPSVYARLQAHIKRASLRSHFDVDFSFGP